MYLYMMVTADELELPMYVSDNLRALAQKMGISYHSAQYDVWRNKAKHYTVGANRGYKVVKVQVDDD